jgi:hypothetical protein
MFFRIVVASVVVDWAAVDMDRRAGASSKLPDGFEFRRWLHGSLVEFPHTLL